MCETPAEATEFTAEERAVLEEAGMLQVDLSTLPHPLPSERAAQRRTELIRTSLTVEEVADRIGEPRALVQARIDAGSLYWIRDDESVLLPAFQFTERGVLPGLELVLRALQADLRQPTSVEGFFIRPQVDLEINDVPVTPIVWLSTGGDIAEVVDLAESLNYAM